MKGIHFLLVDLNRKSRASSLFRSCRPLITKLQIWCFGRKAEFVSCWHSKINAVLIWAEIHGNAERGREDQYSTILISLNTVAYLLTSPKVQHIGQYTLWGEDHRVVELSLQIHRHQTWSLWIWMFSFMCKNSVLMTTTTIPD